MVESPLLSPSCRTDRGGPGTSSHFERVSTGPSLTYRREIWDTALHLTPSPRRRIGRIFGDKLVSVYAVVHEVMSFLQDAHYPLAVFCSSTNSCLEDGPEAIPFLL